MVVNIKFVTHISKDYVWINDGQIKWKVLVSKLIPTSDCADYKRKEVK